MMRWIGIVKNDEMNRNEGLGDVDILSSEWWKKWNILFPIDVSVCVYDKGLIGGTGCKEDWLGLTISVFSEIYCQFFLLSHPFRTYSCFNIAWLVLPSFLTLLILIETLLTNLPSSFIFYTSTYAQTTSVFPFTLSIMPHFMPFIPWDILMYHSSLDTFILVPILTFQLLVKVLSMILIIFRAFSFSYVLLSRSCEEKWCDNDGNDWLKYLNFLKWKVECERSNPKQTWDSPK